MPELPEVETVRSGLAPSLTGAVITDVEILDARSLKRHVAGQADFVASLVGSRIEAVVRRGKFLWLPLTASDDRFAHPVALVGHLGMSGQMLLRDRGADPDKLTRVIVHATEVGGDPVEFRFVDQRLFGSLAIDDLVETRDGLAGGFSEGVLADSPLRDLIPRSAAHIARDPLDPQFDAAAVIGAFGKKNSGIKRVLLDQNLLSGIGNIYADEALWRARLHYDQPAASIGKAKAKELLEHVTVILRDAVAEGGTSFDEQYKNVNGESGYFAVSLNAYGMTGRACNRCGKPIKRDSWMNRGSHFCPHCQRLKIG